MGIGIPRVVISIPDESQQGQFGPGYYGRYPYGDAPVALAGGAADVTMAIGALAGSSGQSLAGAATDTSSASGFISIPAPPSQQIKFASGFLMSTMANYYGTPTTGTGNWEYEINGLVSTDPTLEYVSGYISAVRAYQIEDLTQATNLALTEAAGATGSALQTAINNQYPGIKTRLEAAFYYLQASFPTKSPIGPLYGFWISCAFPSPGNITNTWITQNWSSSSGGQQPVPRDLLLCGGSLTVPTSYGATTTTTGNVAPIYSGASGYGFGCSQLSGSSFFQAVPAWWNPIVNQRQRIQLWQAVGLYTLSTGLAYNSGTAYTVGTPCTYSGQNYLCIANSTGNLPTNTTYFMVNRWAGLTFDEIPEFIVAAHNDEYSWNFTQNISGGQTVNPPYQGATSYACNKANFFAAHKDFVINGQRVAFPHTFTPDNITFTFAGTDATTPTDMAGYVNNALSGNGLSAIRGWGMGCADWKFNIWGQNSWQWNQASEAASGFLGVVSPSTGWGQSYGLISPTANSQIGKALWLGQTQGQLDYSSNSGGTPAQPANETEAGVTAIIQGMAYGGVQIAALACSDATFTQYPTTPNPWTAYILPAIKAWIAANSTADNPYGLPGQLPLSAMYGPAIVSAVAIGASRATIAWNAITGQGTNLNVQLYRNGSQINGANGPAATFTSYTDTAFTPGAIYTLAMVNAYGTGPQGAGTTT
jgi:hypothetical protein